MDLEFTEEMIAQNMPEYSLVNRIINVHYIIYIIKTIFQKSTFQMTVNNSTPSGSLPGIIAPLSGQSLGLQRAQVTNGIREV